MTCTCETSYCTGYCPKGTHDYMVYLYGDPAKGEARTTIEILDALPGMRKAYGGHFPGER